MRAVTFCDVAAFVFLVRGPGATEGSRRTRSDGKAVLESTLPEGLFGLWRTYSIVLKGRFLRPSADYLKTVGNTEGKMT
jgi:hypothetical protein